MLLKYDRDGDGAFSKDEVVSIIIDLKQEHIDNDRLSATNKLYKRLLATAVVLCALLLAGMFALSYAVAVLTAKTDVTSDGTLVAIGTNTPVATDSRADVRVFEKTDGVLCITNDEAMLMLLETAHGKGVIVEGVDADGTQQTVQMNGVGSYTRSDGSICWMLSEGKEVCYEEHPSCNAENAQGRRLSHEERSAIEQEHGRRFLSFPNEGGLGSGNTNGTSSWP